jgi:O-acetyl-ADP-ribose deacetylase (regulator of RNase III)
MHQTLKQDLFIVKADVYAHGCNTLGHMGAGIAVPFRMKWPKMFELYNLYCGLHEAEDLHGTSWYWENPNGPDIACLFTQREWQAGKDLIEQALIHLKGQMLERGHKSLAYPAIGCGLGNVDGSIDEPWLFEKVKEIFKGSGISTTLCIL